MKHVRAYESFDRAQNLVNNVSNTEGRGGLKLLGVTDEREECDKCGKVGLKRVVAFELPDGGITYYGVDCAARVLMGSNSKANRDTISKEAWGVQQVIDQLGPNGVLPDAAADKLQNDMNLNGLPAIKQREGGKMQFILWSNRMGPNRTFTKVRIGQWDVA